MELKDYLKSCSKVLLKKLCELSKDKDLVTYYEKYDQGLSVSDDVDFTWIIISTALLLSENLWQNESAYKDIPNEAIENITDKLCEGRAHIKGDKTINNNCLLDDKNKVANAININEIQGTYDPNGTEITLYKINKKKKILGLDSFDEAAIEFIGKIFDNDIYGCNYALLTDGKMDYRKFIIRVRHALAHSNYEIIDDNFIRLYHYNRTEKRLDFNVALNKSLVITILDELNEFYYKSGKRFVDTWNRFHNEYVYDNKELDEDLVIEQLLKYKMFTLNDCKDILLKAKEDKRYTDDTSVTKLNIIYNCFLEKIKPACSYGIIANEILFGNNKGLVDEEYYQKLGMYKYFNSEFFDINMDTDPLIMDKHIFELYLLAFLNSSLLNEVNLNNNEIFSIIDFSKMHIREEDYTNATLGKNKLVIDLNSRIKKLEKDLEGLNIGLKSKMKIYHNHCELENDYFVNKLPKELYYLISEKSKLIIELNDLYQTLQVTDLINISNYILTHLRNCLAHGYIKIIGDIDLNNVLNTMIEFSDYDPKDKSQLTFRGSITLNDLMAILTSERYVDQVMNQKKIKSKQR